jgi:UPF0755 protein
MKKVIFLLPAFIIFLCGFIIWWNLNTKAISTTQSLKTFVIAKGSSATLIGNKLKDEGFIKNSFLFKLYVQFTGKQQKIQAGEYKLSSSWNLLKIVDQFTKGPGEIWVTIPEGLRREEIVEIVIKSLDKNVQDADIFRNEFINLTKDKEGFLFPDTYLFPQMATASVVVNKLTQTFDKKVNPNLLSQIKKTPFSLEEVITVASLVERETRNDSERPLVAGIIYKRLQANWPLQIDASVQYAVSNTRCVKDIKNCDWWPGLTKDDIQIKSSFNTYKNTGLPPQPISNPGINSIDAAIYPETSTYWFYLHDSKGVIHYARTIEEHNYNIATYLR